MEAERGGGEESRESARLQAERRSRSFICRGPALPLPGMNYGRFSPLPKTVAPGQQRLWLALWRDNRHGPDCLLARTHRPGNPQRPDKK